MSGFRMKPDSILTGFPLDTRLYLGQSRSGPWGRIGTSILATSPSNDNEISVTFPSQSFKYFRVDFRDSPGRDFAIFRTFTLLTTQNIDVFETMNTRITQLENVPPGTTDLGPLEASVDALGIAGANQLTVINGNISRIQARRTSDRSRRGWIQTKRRLIRSSRSRRL